MDVALVTGRSGPAFMHEVDVPLVAALDRRGARVHAPRWDDPGVDWSGFDVAVVRTTWDYFQRREAFLDWAAATARRTSLWNPVEVLRWNTHKSYLLELEDRGAPIVPTAWLARGDRVDLCALLRQRGWDTAVVKPAVAAGASGLRRVAIDDPQAQTAIDRLLAVDDVLVQPFLADVVTSGELSVVVVDGEPSHAVRKRPADGDFRVQQEFGGRYEPAPVDADTAALVRWLVDATGHELLAARVDLIEDGTGTAQVVELEATEPDLYLTVVPEAADGVADAVLRHVTDGSRPTAT